jgi:hypothetical protein
MSHDPQNGGINQHPPAPMSRNRTEANQSLPAPEFTASHEANVRTLCGARRLGEGIKARQMGESACFLPRHGDQANCIVFSSVFE